jgi:short-subunit dehydrogenase
MDKSGRGRTALVTGASAGIGRAFARLLAGEGYDVILTARRVDRLDALARELSDEHGVAAHVVPIDLADPAAPARLVEVIESRGLHVDVLVNNAGYGVPGSYASTRWHQQDAFLQVVVVAVAELTHRLLPAMIERRWGRIINVASLAGLLPGVAGHTLYAAAKSLVIRFSESLALETRHHGVLVSAVCPGFTLSEFHDVTGTRAQVNTMPWFMWLEAETVARDGYAAVMRGDPVCVTGRLNKAIAVIARLLPQRLVRSVMRRNAGRYRKV